MPSKVRIYKTWHATQWLKHGDHPAVRPFVDSDDVLLTGMGGTELLLPHPRELCGVLGSMTDPINIVYPGQWIIDDGRGHLGVVTQEQMDMNFRTVEDSEPIPRLWPSGDWQPIHTCPAGRDVLLCGQMDGPHDYRIKMGYRDSSHWTGFRLYGGSWKPEAWMPLPKPLTRTEP